MMIIVVFLNVYNISAPHSLRTDVHVIDRFFLFS